MSVFSLWLLGFVLCVEGPYSPGNYKVILLHLFRDFDNFFFFYISVLSSVRILVLLHSVR